MVSLLLGSESVGLGWARGEGAEGPQLPVLIAHSAHLF